MIYLLKCTLLFLTSCCLSQTAAETPDTHFPDTSVATCNQQFTIPQDQLVNQPADTSYNYRPDMICEAPHLSTDIQGNKYTLRHSGFYRKFCPKNLSDKKYITHIIPPSHSDPVTYYVFGLRKIII